MEQNVFESLSTYFKMILQIFMLMAGFNWTIQFHCISVHGCFDGYKKQNKTKHKTTQNNKTKQTKRNKTKTNKQTTITNSVHTLATLWAPYSDMTKRHW